MTKHETGIEIVRKLLVHWGYTVFETGKDKFDLVMKRPTHDLILIEVKADKMLQLTTEEYNHYMTIVDDDRYPELRILFVDAERGEVYGATFKHLIRNPNKREIGAPLWEWDREVCSMLASLKNADINKLEKA